ncbi:uncharacterized protein [Lepeophtheirus salmonis]|uniref:uncharacterized protein n=1 Tax=Lepeophtheirus salmonis TaxID=72036 RepID=UPI003AF349CB
MVKVLPRLTLAELRRECSRLELGSEDELRGKKKLELVVLVREYIEGCGCDPKSFDFNDGAQASGDGASGTTGQLGVRQPSPFVMDGPRRGHRWSSWWDEFEIYVSLFGKLSPERKKSLLPHCAGTEVQQWFNTIQIVAFPEEDVFTSTVRAIRDAFSPTECLLFERFRLSEMKQGVGEPVDDYVTRLRGQAKFGRFACGSCKVSFEDEIILDVVVKNTSSPRLRQTVFERGSTKLTDVLSLARALETSISHAKEMESSETVMASEYIGPKGLRRSKGTWSTQKANPKMDRGNCKFCGRSHVFQKTKCPAFGKECSRCGKMGHFRVCCPSSALSSSSISFQLNDGVGDRAYAFLRINGRRVKMLLDLGSNVNILPKHLVDRGFWWGEGQDSGLYQVIGFIKWF